MAATLAGAGVIATAPQAGAYVTDYIYVGNRGGNVSVCARMLATKSPAGYLPGYTGYVWGSYLSGSNQGYSACNDTYGLGDLDDPYLYNVQAWKATSASENSVCAASYNAADSAAYATSVAVSAVYACGIVDGAVKVTGGFVPYTPYYKTRFSSV